MAPPGGFIPVPEPVVRRRGERGPSKHAKMPPKGSPVSELVKVRHRVSKHMLQKRLKEYTPAQMKEFNRLSGIKERMGRRHRGGSNLKAWKEWANEKWLEMCTDFEATYQTVSLERLSLKFYAHFGIKKSVSAISRWIPKSRFLKPAGTYIKPSNEPSFHYKLQALGKR